MWPSCGYGVPWHKTLAVRYGYLGLTVPTFPIRFPVETEMFVKRHCMPTYGR